MVSRGSCVVTALCVLASLLACQGRVIAHEGAQGLTWAAACRRSLSTWAERGKPMAMMCREAFPEPACSAVEDAFGGEWPVLHSPIGAARTCLLLEQSLHAVREEGPRRSLMLSQRRSSIRDVPQWVKEAPSLYEDPDVTESPYPLDSSPSTWDGARLEPNNTATR
mmetsp:Transcript_92099/g.214060  ORF Transcript_92099/g.214060 Transcript_92099/m.214060 type:complete len:166 (-) Transcript_92099:33-530(-)